MTDKPWFDDWSVWQNKDTVYIELPNYVENPIEIHSKEADLVYEVLGKLFHEAERKK